VPFVKHGSFNLMKKMNEKNYIFEGKKYGVASFS
jgi:hypothetical protein